MRPEEDGLDGERGRREDTATRIVEIAIKIGMVRPGVSFNFVSTACCPAAVTTVRWTRH